MYKYYIYKSPTGWSHHRRKEVDGGHFVTDLTAYAFVEVTISLHKNRGGTLTTQAQLSY